MKHQIKNRITSKVLFECDIPDDVETVNEVKYALAKAVKEKATMSHAGLSGADLYYANLSGADLSNAILSNAYLSRANLSGADLTGADLRDCVLVGAKTFAWNVSEANMSGALTDKPAGPDVLDLPYEKMIHEHARWCETGGQEGSPSVFDGADLRNLKTISGFNLTALSAKGATFYGLDMQGIQLQGAHLEGADLRNCNLRRADLRGARLQGAKLSGSDLRDAQMGPLLIAPERNLPCDMTRALLKNADLARADLRQAILVDADLSRANFTGAVIKGIDITGAQREGARGLESTL